MRRRILIAPDKFKGSLTAWEAADAIARGLEGGGLTGDRFDLRELPIADGGEGTAEVVRRSMGGECISCPVRDPLGKWVEASYARIQDRGETVALLEMSQASGLWRLEDEERGRPDASTHGTGDLIRHALHEGADRLVLGLGGSATNDGGTGMAEVLGVRFLDGAGDPVSPLPAELERVRRVDLSDRCELPEMIAACDVGNPLLGPRGCTRVFGGQKGIAETDMDRHEAGLRALADAVRRSLGRDFAAEGGAGAAGGLGFGCLAFCEARLEPGFPLVANLLHLEQAVAEADLVITGEGSLDRQTLDGKGPHGVARRAAEAGKPILTFCGVCEDSPEVAEVFPEVRALRSADRPLHECLERGAEFLAEAAWDAAAWVLEQIEG